MTKNKLSCPGRFHCRLAIAITHVSTTGIPWAHYLINMQIRKAVGQFFCCDLGAGMLCESLAELGLPCCTSTPQVCLSKAVETIVIPYFQVAFPNCAIFSAELLDVQCGIRVGGSILAILQCSHFHFYGRSQDPNNDFNSVCLLFSREER